MTNPYVPYNNAGQQQVPPGYAAAPPHVTQQPPQPQYLAQPGPTGPRVLHVYQEGMIHRRTQILDSDKSTVLYNITHNSGSLFSSKPHMTIYAGASDRHVVGTVTFHSMSSDIDLVVHGQPIPLTSGGIFSSSYQFRSSGGAVVKWKKDGMFSGGDMLCLDENDKILARFDNNNWAITKDGKFVLEPAVAGGGRGMDEIVVSGIAMAENRRRKEQAAASAATA